MLCVYCYVYKKLNKNTVKKKQTKMRNVLANNKWSWNTKITKTKLK